MAVLAIIFDPGGKAAKQFERKSKTDAARVSRSIASVAEFGLKQILNRGKSDIASAGKYGPRWVQGLKGSITGRGTNKTIITIKHDIPYYPFLNKGGLIKGNPILWLPMPGTPVGVPPRNYPGKLVRVAKRGATPVLIDPVQKQVKYFGKKSVRISQKFHINEIIRQVQSEFPAEYKKAMVVNKAG